MRSSENFLGTRHRSPNLADDDARRRIGELGGFSQCCSGCQRRGNRRRNRISCTGYVVHLLRPRRKMMDCVGIDQRHTLFTARRENRTNAARLHQTAACRQDGSIVMCWHPRRRRQFLPIRRHNACPRISGIIGTLGINDDRPSGFASKANQPRQQRVRQHALAVIRQKQDTSILDVACDGIGDRIRNVIRDIFNRFSVGTHHLLTARNIPRLNSRAATRDDAQSVCRLTLLGHEVANL